MNSANRWSDRTPDQRFFGGQLICSYGLDFHLFRYLSLPGIATFGCAMASTGEYFSFTAGVVSFLVKFQVGWFLFLFIPQIRRPHTLIVCNDLMMIRGWFFETVVRVCDIEVRGIGLFLTPAVIVGSKRFKIFPCLKDFDLLLETIEEGGGRALYP